MRFLLLGFALSLASEYDRPYTLLNIVPGQMEWSAHTELTGLADSLVQSWGFLNLAQGDQALKILPLLGIEQRFDESRQITALDGGLVIDASKNAMVAHLDARIFSEFYQKGTPYRYDREFVELQSKEDHSNLNYVSYARYRGHFGYSSPIGFLSAGHDVLQWGPGIFHNLTFSQNAVPFHNIQYRDTLGFLEVQSVYGMLDIDGLGGFGTLDDDLQRNLYAHRYQFHFANTKIGVSEQLILYKKNQPFAFIPIVPLFMEKGLITERMNNGNISFDVSQSLFKKFRLYTEFFIDDLWDPSSLFGSMWKNKWAWMGGLQYASSHRGLQYGAIFEFARIEPWVYTHYEPQTAQTANAGYPLGSQAGPNSLNFTLKTYARANSKWYLGLRGDLYAKGSTRGSDIADYEPDSSRISKVFLSGSDGLHLRTSLELSRVWDNVALQLMAEHSVNPMLVLRSMMYF